MAINFPDSPSVNDTHTVGDKTWTWDGTVWMVTNAVTSLEVIATVALVDADADTKIQLEESADEDKIRFDTAGSERLIIDASGNVGIGTTTPNVVLDIHGNSNSLRLTGTDHVYQEFYADGTVAGRSGYLGYGNATDDNLRINNSITGGDIDFYTENAVRMTIDSAGNVGIGTNSPTSALEVADTNPSTLTLKSKNTVLQVDNEVQAIDFYQSDASGGAGVSARIVGVASNISGAEALTFHTGQAGASASPVAERMRINSNGNVGIGTSGPNSLLEVSSDTGTTPTTPTEIRISTSTNGGPWSTSAPWGQLSFWSADTSNGGAAKVQAAVAATARDEFGGLGRLGFFLHNQTGGSLTEHVSITPDGKVGIGTTVPSDSLTVDDGIIHARSSQSGTTGLGTDKGIALTAYGMNTSSKYTPGVLFGSRDPQFTTTNPKYNAGIYGVATETYGADTDTGMDLEFRITWIDQGTGHGLVQSGGYRMGTTSFYPLTHDQSDLGTSTLSWDDVYATSGTVNTSDERDKANIADLDLGLAFVDSLRPVSYTWNDRSGYVGTRTHMGFVAQEVATSLGDEAVNRGLWINSPTVPLDPENPEGEQSVERQGLRYHQLLAPMVKAIQELSATVQTLTARIEALETN